MMENWISWLWPALPFLASNAIVFTVAYFSIKSDVQEEIADRTEAPDRSDVDADPESSLWCIRILNAGLVLCVILPTVGFSADKWIRLFRSDLGHNGSVGLCDLLLSCGIWGGGICVLDKLLSECPVLRGRLKKINIYLPYIRWTLLSLCSAIFTNTWYNAHLLSSAFPDNPISEDPILGLFLPAGLTVDGRVVMDALAGIAIAGWFPGRAPAEKFETRYIKMAWRHIALCYTPIVEVISRRLGISHLPAQIWSSISSLDNVHAVLDLMHENQIVLFGGETATVFLWAAYAWYIISYLGTMLGLLWRSNVFMRSFAITLLFTCSAMSFYPHTRRTLAWVLIGGSGSIFGTGAITADDKRLMDFKVEHRSERRTDSPGVETLKEKGPPV